MPSPEKLPVSPFSEAYERLLANGYSVLPISPHSKAPSEYRGGKWRPMNEWQRYRDTPASGFILRAWAGWPDGNIGILTGTRATATHIVACVDYDSDDPDVLIELQRAIPASPVMKRGKRGFSAFYLVPNGTEGFRTAVVELLTDTRQTVIPPSIHPDTGRAYQWTGSATLLDTPAAALPVLTDDDLARFRDTVEALTQRPIGQGGHVVRFPYGEPLRDGEKSPWRMMNERALLNLDAWVPGLKLPKLQRTGQGYKGVAYWRMSSTGRSLEQRAPNLSMTAAGIRDFGSGSSYTALDLVQVVFALDLEEAFRWLGARVGGVEEEGFAQQAPSPPASSETALPPHDPETGEIIEEVCVPVPDRAAVVADEQDELPEHLTRVPGLLGEVIDWIANGARRPNRTMALGAAVTIIGTAIGQAIAGPTGSATHLYVVALAPSGAGKDHPLQSISRLLKASNNGALIGPSEFISMPAVIKFLSRRPLAVCAMDEIGAFLKRLAHPKSSSYEKSISKVLRSVWGTSFAPMMTPEWASVEATEIENPALSIFGVSTPAEFFSALEGDDVINGFLNRWMLLTTARKVRDCDPLHPPGHVPAELALALARLRNEANALSEAERSAPIGDGRAVKRLVWNGGRGGYELLLNDVERVSRDEDVAPFYARTAEMAVRLATIQAAARGSKSVSAEDMQWGREVAWWSAGRMALLARSYIAENDTQRMHNRVMRIITRRGGRMSHRDLVKTLNGALTSRGLKDIMDQMLASGEVVAHKGIPTGGGPPTITYEVQRGG